MEYFPEQRVLGPKTRTRKKKSRYFKTNENVDTMTPKLLDTDKAILREKFIPIQTYIKKPEKS